MVYNQKFVVCIKAEGKILRENKDLVQLPFGSEFSVFVKNLNSRRVKFTLQIDGQDVLDGTEIIVDANSESEIKRFIRNGNLNEGNAFKFIERTSAIEDGPRGIKVEDGVVRVEYWFEKEVPEIKTTYHRDVWWDEHLLPRYRKSVWETPYYGSVAQSSGPLSQTKTAATRGSTLGSSASMIQGASTSYSSNSIGGQSVSDSSLTSAEVSINDVGITVPGSKVQQQFQAVYGFNPEAQSHVIVIRLTGRSGTMNIAAPVTVKTKQKCSTCDHTNKANANFCSQCGTSLELV